MKKIILFSVIMSAFLANGQSLSYSDAAVLFSTDDNYGTARFVGMGGAFGALGGDLSAADINPAGLAVFNNTEFSTTIGYRNTQNKSTFYGPSITSEDDYFRFTQAGAVLVFDTFSDSGFSKFTLGFNYNLIKDFDNNYIVQGNSGVSDFDSDPYLNYDNNPINDIYYDNVENQFFRNYTSGTNDRFTLSFATQYEDLLYLGFSMSFQNLDFYQSSIYEEDNSDENGNTLNGYTAHYLTTLGNGVNFGFGAILKPITNLRLGLSYQSPIWYDISEKFVEDIEIDVSNNPELYTEYYEPNFFDYKLKSPGKVTGSIAYVFGKSGLLSFDYIYKDFSNTSLSPSSAFIDDNQGLSNSLTNTSSFKIGGEWRYKIMSFRGGYNMTESPYANADSSFDITGYSLGLGIQFNRIVKLDFAYDNTSYTDQYSFLNLDGVDAARLDINNDRFTTTLSISF